MKVLVEFNNSICAFPKGSRVRITPTKVGGEESNVISFKFPFIGLFGVYTDFSNKKCS